VWPLDWLFRSFGSYFVRRGEKDPLYHRVLERYLQLVASRGLTTAFFLEGGLTRTGALRAPKIGLLDYLVGILRTEPDREIVFIPVGINFDRVLEDRQLLHDAGPPSPLQKLLSLLSLMARAPLMVAAVFTRATLRSHQKYGYAAVSFGAPIRLEDVLPEAVRVASLPDAERRPQLARLADDLLARVAETIPATPIPMVCRALLDGVADVTALRRHVRDQIADARAHGRSVAEGRAYDSVRRGRARLTGEVADKDELDRAILDGEEAEITVDLALRLLRRRALVTSQGPALALTEPGRALAAYYARSLDAPSAFAVR
jgi:glycerol-3-phosphate O-acyltransferase